MKFCSKKNKNKIKSASALTFQPVRDNLAQSVRAPCLPYGRNSRKIARAGAQAISLSFSGDEKLIHVQRSVRPGS
jgi:hypothetical protein